MQKGQPRRLPIGTQCQLKSGGPTMTVLGYEVKKGHKLGWFCTDETGSSDFAIIYLPIGALKVTGHLAVVPEKKT